MWVYATWVRYPPLVCRMPFGFPVVPEVYRMNSGFSASKPRGSCSASAASSASCHQTSRPSVQSTSFSPRRTTSTCCTVLGLPSMASAASAVSTVPLSPNTRPLRQPPSAVMTSFASASSMRARRLSALNPPKTTECTAPRRATASMAMTASGMTGR